MWKWRLEIPLRPPVFCHCTAFHRTRAFWATFLWKQSCAEFNENPSNGLGAYTRPKVFLFYFAKNTWRVRQLYYVVKHCDWVMSPCPSYLVAPGFKNPGLKPPVQSEGFHGTLQFLKAFQESALTGHVRFLPCPLQLISQRSITRWCVGQTASLLYAINKTASKL
jgi:hypothetical protein